MRLLLSSALLALPLSLAIAGCSGDDTGSTETASTGSTSMTASAGESETGDDPMTQLCGSGDAVAGSGTNLMEKWGAPCTTDQACKDLTGDADAECLIDILDIYVLPQGYCYKPCDLDPGVQYVPDSPMCGDGMTCLGADGFFEACAVPCTSDDECQRDGYTCQILPTLGMEGDPKFCLMNTTCTKQCIMDPMMDGCLK
ncbi:MAG: hypothetical protein KC420_08280 [Myxococcales bacterium]|nr:hypothetical protein [Myxococcales bacterium]MCB9568534.1 hypothetical protein [Myxococcales bacterium]MCB9701981.1 hypothetical protein [Myxococcales bacterium]